MAPFLSPDTSLTMPRRARRAIPIAIGALALALLLPALLHRRPPATPVPETPTQSPAPGPPPKPPAPPADLHLQFDPARALDHARHLDALGARPPGSSAIASARDYLRQQLELAGWMIIRQEFQDPTPAGPIHFCNLIARQPPETSGPDRPAIPPTIPVVAHCDTATSAVGTFPCASASAVAPGVILELARIIAPHPSLARRVEFALLDGHHPRTQNSPTDGLHGARRYARLVEASRSSRPIPFAVVLDALGLPDGTLVLPPELSDPALQPLLRSVDALDIAALFSEGPRPLWGDHLAFIAEKIPVTLLSQADHPSLHTADDSIDKIDPDAVRDAGRLVLHMLRANAADGR